MSLTFLTVYALFLVVTISVVILDMAYLYNGTSGLYWWLLLLVLYILYCYNVIMALLRFLSLFFTIESIVWLSIYRFSWWLIVYNIWDIWWWLGHGTLIIRHLDFNGIMILTRLDANMMILHFWMYFSIVLLRPAYATDDRQSPWLMMTTFIDFLSLSLSNTPLLLPTSLINY